MITLNDDALVMATVGKDIKDPESRELLGRGIRQLCDAARRGEPEHLRAVLQSYRDPNPAPDDPIESAIKSLQLLVTTDVQPT